MQLRYVGRGGEFLMGVPARDLSDDDFAELPEFAQAYLKAHLKLPNSIYEEVAGPKAASRRARAAAPAGARKSRRGAAPVEAPPAEEAEA